MACRGCVAHGGLLEITGSDSERTRPVMLARARRRDRTLQEAWDRVIQAESGASQPREARRISRTVGTGLGRSVDQVRWRLGQQVVWEAGCQVRWQVGCRPAAHVGVQRQRAIRARSGRVALASCGWGQAMAAAVGRGRRSGCPKARWHATNLWTKRVLGMSTSESRAQRSVGQIAVVHRFVMRERTCG